MAKKRKKRKSSRRRKYEADIGNRFEMSPETKRGVTVVALFLVGLVTALAMLDLAGPAGTYVAQGLVKAFGWGDFLAPIILIALGYFLLLPHRYEVKAVNYLGLFLFILSFYGFLHITQGAENLQSAIELGKGGGFVGLTLSWPLAQALGAVAGGVVIFAVLLISLLLTFNASFNLIFGEENIFRRVFLGTRTYITHKRYSDNGLNDKGFEGDEGIEGDEEEEIEEGEALGVDEVEGVKGVKEGIEDGVGDEEVELEKPRRRLPKIDLPMDLLTGKIGKPTSGDIRANQQVILRTLENFNIDVEMGEVNVGPTVTQYTLKPAEGVKLSQITALQNDLSLALAAHPIRLEAPIPGRSLVGVEVPNKAVATVTLKEVVTSIEFKRQRPSELSLPLGKDVSGKPYIVDLKKMPHLLIAGATGSGKSVAINSIIVALMYQNQPSDLKFIMVDPKRVELTSYADIPYLLTPVIVDVKKTVSALRWSVSEMERRFGVLQAAGKRNIESFNNSVANGEKLSYIVIVIDELADLMAAAAAEVEGQIVRLAQMARAVGIHLIVATQRPSVDVLTGLIKANITSRIAFSVASLVDSRTILDSSGAEKLLGRGDLLFVSAEVSKPKRLQGAYVSDKEIETVASFLKQKAKPDYLDIAARPEGHEGVDSYAGSDESDELLGDAKEVITQAGKASASLLQRRLRVGYARAARLLDILEDQGIIGPAEGAKPREVYLSREEDMSNEDAYPEKQD